MNILSLQFGVPAYIVTLRHQCAHRALPSLEALKCGAGTALQWLLDNYWEPQRQHNQQREENSGKRVSEEILQRHLPFILEGMHVACYGG